MKPRCKKCGRVLRDPISISRGMGPECSGAAPIKKGSSRAKISQKGRSPQSYAAQGTGAAKSVGVGQPVDSPSMRRKALAQAFQNRKRFTVGKSAFIPLGDDSWLDESTNKEYTHQHLEGWLLRYGLIHRSTIQNQNQPVS